MPKNSITLLIIFNDFGTNFNESLKIVPGERDVLISDKAADELKIVLLKPGAGIWRFIDDPPETTRKSAESLLKILLLDIKNFTLIYHNSLISVYYKLYKILINFKQKESIIKYIISMF